MPTHKRLYIITGKGGVGKTTMSLALCKKLNDLGHPVRYTFFQNSSLSKDSKEFNQGQKLATKLGVDIFPLNLNQCAGKYIAKKLGSKTISSWIIKTPFFKSLVNMIPGFSYLIFLGQILEDLNNDPKLIVVLDSPSSGHALTMLEATKNFKDIFKSGAVFDDTNKMLNKLYEPNFTQIHILGLPTQMAIHESIELKEQIREIRETPVDIICNNCYGTIPGIEQEILPDFLKNKSIIEESILADYSDTIDSTITHSTKLVQIDVIKDLVPLIENLV